MIKQAQGEENNERHWRAISEEVLKEWRKSFNGRWGGIKGQWEGAKVQWKGIKGQWGVILKENEEALMGDKRRYRATEGVLRRHRGIN